MSENTTHESPAYEKRGYLNHEFRLFHLRGQMDTPVAYHYHDFHKVQIGRASCRERVSSPV